MFKDLDSLLLSQLRLGIMSLLMSVEDAEFGVLKDQTGATSGNLSVQIDKLKKAGYITVTKTFRNNYPLTICKITPEGSRAFIAYSKNIQEYLLPQRNKQKEHA